MGRYVIKIKKRLAELATSIALLSCFETCRVIVSIMVDINFFRASTVTYAFLLGRGGLADRGFAHELSEASCTSGDAEVLTAGALSLRVCARVVLHTTIATTFSPQTAPI